ncbi:MAG: hypothetical protein WCS37_19570, partial [Chloroflexota bacterium]
MSQAGRKSEAGVTSSGHRPPPTTSYQVQLMGVDHSWVEEVGRSLVYSGELTEQELLTNKRRHTITRALGMEGEVLADFNTAQLQPGELVMLCSDGLWDLIEPRLLEEFLLTATSDLSKLEGDAAQVRLATLVDRLEETVLVAGGRDNITLNVALVESIGRPVNFPSLPALLVQTARDVDERTAPAEKPDLVEESPTPPPPALRPYQPLFTASRAEAASLGSLSSLNLDANFSKAQKLFALGHWDEALEEFLQIENQDGSYRNLFEVLSNSLLRYVEGSMQQDRPERVLRLITWLNQSGVLRYHDLLFDYCLEESRKASQDHDYARTKTFASFAAQFRPNDGRTRNLQELSELYLTLHQADDLPLNERLTLAQKIYARDADFGAIQDELALIYMELGDEAAHEGEENDALTWYQMIRPLRPEDTRLVSLALNKQRAIEDTLARRENSSTTLSEMITKPLISRPGSTVVNRAEERTRAAEPERTRAAEPERTRAAEPVRTRAAEPEPSEGRTDNEVLNRLRERVSRAQKAWDGGRKEVGAEYIYLVEQLSALISPNPWQPTFPRVCYDYGKWLLDQKQYSEARPYFHKAHTLGMATAQQRINEIDRTLRDLAAGVRGPTPLDLPDNQPPTRDWIRGKGVGASEVPPSLLSNRQPLIQRHTDTSENTTFVGTSHAGDGVLGSDRKTDTSDRSDPLSAAALAAGNNATETGNRERYEKSERSVGASGTLRRRDSEVDPLHSAASREVSRLQNQGLPQATARPDLIQRRRTEGLLNLIGGLTPTFLIGLVGIVVIVGLILIFSLLFNQDKKINQATPTVIVMPTNTVTTSNIDQTATAQFSGPTSITARLEGIAASDVRLFLATPNDSPVAYRERELSLDNGIFRLPQAIVDKLDPKLKYILVARPKDSTTHKYQADLTLDSPLQQIWAKTNVSFIPKTLTDISLKIMPEALSFYPLDNGDQDLDLPTGGHYYRLTRHTIQNEFFRFYNDNGGLGRYGYPISEEFDWKDVGTVQFFERGWLVRSP